MKDPKVRIDSTGVFLEWERMADALEWLTTVDETNPYR